jgi:phosphate starvation-inducible PhoH-like protein
MARRQKANASKVVDFDQQLEVVSPELKSKKEKKIKFQLLLKKLEAKVILKENQLIYSKKIENNTITFAYGPAGSSKTFSACYTLLKLLFKGEIDRIIFTKPIKESGENLGFLPGDISQKLEPYMESFIYTCKEMVGDETVKFLIDNGFIENRPLAYMRGISFKKCGMFLDEMQNATEHQLYTYITRMGSGSKLILAGDMNQTDIDVKKSQFLEFISFLKKLVGISVHEFTREDIVRHPLLIQITDEYEKWKKGKGL